MNGRFLLDTNIVIAFFARDENVLDGVKDASELYISLITAGELYYGASKSSKVQANATRVNSLVTDIPVVYADADTAKLFGSTKAILRRNGTPVPDHDIWIGVIALQHSLTLVTRDDHFSHVEGLTVTKW